MRLPENIKKIGVFRALQLGDMLCVIPAMRALRAAFPEARIVLLGLPWASSLVSRFPNYFDGFIHFPGFPGLPEQAHDTQSFDDFSLRMKAENFDLLLQMQGNGNIVNLMLTMLECKLLAGFYKKNVFIPSKELFVEYPEGIHEIDRHLTLMRHLGIESQGRYLEFPLTPSDEAELASLALDQKDQSYICIHPGSRGSWRQWPIENFAAIGDYANSQGLQVFITGTRDEMPITEAVQMSMKTQAVNLTGKTSLGAIGVLIRDAFALVSNCTGVSHIAAALETPSIVISMDGEPERWAPLNKSLHRTFDWTKSTDFETVLEGTADLFSELKFRESSPA